MVNLEEILEKKPYTCPIMVVERIDFSDVIVTSGGGVGEPIDPNRPTPSETPPGQEIDQDDPFG